MSKQSEAELLLDMETATATAKPEEEAPPAVEIAKDGSARPPATSSRKVAMPTVWIITDFVIALLLALVLLSYNLSIFCGSEDDPCGSGLFYGNEQPAPMWDNVPVLVAVAASMLTFVIVVTYVVLIWLLDIDETIHRLDRGEHHTAWHMSRVFVWLPYPFMVCYTLLWLYQLRMDIITTTAWPLNVWWAVATWAAMACVFSVLKLAMLLFCRAKFAEHKFSFYGMAFQTMPVYLPCKHDATTVEGELPDIKQQLRQNGHIVEDYYLVKKGPHRAVWFILCVDKHPVECFRTGAKIALVPLCLGTADAMLFEAMCSKYAHNSPSTTYDVRVMPSADP